MTFLCNICGQQNTLEHLDQEELERIAKVYTKLAEEAKCTLAAELKTGIPRVDPHDELVQSSVENTESVTRRGK